MNTNDTSCNKEGDFEEFLLSLIEKGGSIRSLLQHSKFLARLARFTRKRDFRAFRGERDSEDLAQDINVKLLQAELSEKLRIPDNVKTEEQFFTWLFFVVRNLHLDTIRHHLAQKRDGLRSLKSLEDFDLPALELNQDREEILAWFPEFIKQYSVDRQWAIRLWLKGKSYRRIVKILQRLGRPTVSHATVGNWINAILQEFRENLETLSQKRTGT